MITMPWPYISGSDGRVGLWKRNNMKNGNWLSDDVIQKKILFSGEWPKIPWIIDFCASSQRN